MKSLFRVSLLVATALASSTAYAGTAKQSGDAPTASDNADQVVGEIIVTAQKRSERLNDVPLSISAVSGEQLERRGISSPADLEKVVPGFTYQLSQYGTPVFSIRGIGFFDNQIAVSPAVTVYTDQIPVPYARMSEGAALDLERVEVLKGPQGTLFGQNSTGGAVNYIAAKPTRSFAAGVDATYGRFNEFNLGGFVSGPVSDTLGLRLAARYESRDGWQQSITRNETSGKRDFLVGRLLAGWEPTDGLKIELNVNGWRNRSDLQVTQPRGYLPVNPAAPTTSVTIATAAGLTAFPYVTTDNNRLADWDPGFSRQRDDKYYQIAGRIEYDVSSDVRIISLTAYSNLDSYNPIDIDGTSVFADQIVQFGKISSFSQELRLEGSAGDRFNWVAGANYQKDKSTDFQTVRLQGSNAELIGIHFDGLDLLNRQNVRDVAGFVSADYKLTDQLKLQASLRYTDENRDFEGCISDTGGPIGFRIPLNLAGLNVASGGCITLLPNGTSGLYRSSLNEDNVSWRVSLDYKASPDVLLYANVTKGYKAGSFGSLPAVSYLQYKPVNQESVLAYEAGFKASLADRKVDLSGAAFYYDYADKQIYGFILVPPFGNLPNLINIPKSRVVGAEFNATLTPIDGLRLSGGVTYLDSKTQGSTIVPSPFGNIADVNGEAFPATPKWQLQFDGEYQFPVGAGAQAFIGSSYSYRSGTTAAFASKTGPVGTQGFFDIKGYGLLDLRAGIEFDRKYRIQVFGRNVTGTQYWNNVTHIYDTYARVTGMPATYGVTVSAQF